MTYDQIYKASEEWHDSGTKPYISKNALYKGLAVLAKYTDDMSIWVGHEEIYVGFDWDEEVYDKMTQEDLEVLFTHGFSWDSGNECFHKFI